MAIDHFIKFDGISGESNDEHHRDEIEVLSWSWGLSAAGSASKGGGSAKRRASPADFSFVHRYDKASPILAKRAAKGKRIAQATLSARPTGDGRRDFLQVTMHDVLVSSVTYTGDDSEILCAVTLRFKRIDVEYIPTDERGGAGAPVTFGWNIATNTVT